MQIPTQDGPGSTGPAFDPPLRWGRFQPAYHPQKTEVMLPPPYDEVLELSDPQEP
jgi:hypothetical protein